MPVNKLKEFLDKLCNDGKGHYEIIIMDFIEGYDLSEDNIVIVDNLEQVWIQAN